MTDLDKEIIKKINSHRALTKREVVPVSVFEEKWATKCWRANFKAVTSFYLGEKKTFVIEHRAQKETLQQVGDQLNLSRERIRQIENLSYSILAGEEAYRRLLNGFVNTLSEEEARKVRRPKVISELKENGMYYADIEVLEMSSRTVRVITRVVGYPATIGKLLHIKDLCAHNGFGRNTCSDIIYSLEKHGIPDINGWKEKMKEHGMSYLYK